MTSFSQRVRPVTREPYKWEKDAGGPASDMNAETNREQIDIFVRALFKHAMPGSYVSLRSFHDDESTKSFAIECLQVDDHDRIVDAAYRQASRAALLILKLCSAHRSRPLAITSTPGKTTLPMGSH